MGVGWRIASAAAGLLLLAATVAALRYTVFLDFDAWLDARARSHPAPPDTLRALAALHAGPGPCLRYLTGPLPDEELDAAAHALLATGLSPTRIQELTGQFVVWIEDREAAAHARGEDEERAALRAGDDPEAKLVLWLHRRRLNRSAADMVEHFAEEAAQHWAHLAPAQREQVKAVFDARPHVFTQAGLFPLYRRLDALGAAHAPAPD